MSSFGILHWALCLVTVNAALVSQSDSSAARSLRLHGSHGSHVAREAAWWRARRENPDKPDKSNYSDTCVFAKDGECDDGSLICQVGTDCTDCKNCPPPDASELAEKKAKKKLKQEQKQFHESATDLPNKLMRLGSADDHVQKELKHIVHKNMPNLDLSREVLTGVVMAILLSIMWFAFWYHKIYKEDRIDRYVDDADLPADSNKSIRLGLEELLHGAHEACVLSPEMPTVSVEPDKSAGIFAGALKKSSLEEIQEKINPDLILVLYHPTFDDGDDEKPIPKKDLQSVFEGQAKSEGKSANFEETMPATAKVVGDGASETVTLEVARRAILEDVYRLLHSMSFEVYVFSSIDDDEIFVCASLQNAEVLYQYVQLEGNEIQLANDIAAKVGVGQPCVDEDAASIPAYLDIDRRFINRLSQNPAVGPSFKEMGDMYNLAQFAPGSTLRVRHMYRELIKVFNTRTAQKLKLVVDWYPSHRRSGMAKLRRVWFDESIFLNLFRQPVHLLHEYYGERCAFLLAWIGHFCKMIVALAVPALAAELMMLGARRGHWHYDTISEVVQLSFGWILVLWGAIALRLWDRQQAFLQACWCSEDSDEHNIVRPSFKGEWLPSELDNHELVKTGDRAQFIRAQVISVVVTILCCTGVIYAIHAWFFVSGGKLHLLETIILAIMVKVFELLFNMIAEELTLAENHKYQNDHYNSWSMKLFVFYTINYYYAFVHIAFFLPGSPAGCPPQETGGCRGLLKTQLFTLYCTVVFSAFLNCVISEVTVRLNVWFEARALRKKREEDAKRDGLEPEEVGELSIVEKQSKFGQFNEREQIETMTQLVTALGFLLLFGAVAPSLVVPAMVVFAGYLKFTAYLLTYNTKRPFPWGLNGIGSWNHAIHFLGGVGVIFTGFFTVNDGPFEDTPMIAKLSASLVFILVSMILRALVNAALETPDAETLRLRGRRQKVLKRIHQVVLADGEQNPQAQAGSKASMAKQSRRTVPALGPQAKVDWNNVPNLKPRAAR